MVIRADFEALVSEAVRLDESADSLGARVRAVQARVEDLLSSGWTGDAATQFRPLFDAWIDAAESSTARLSEMTLALNAATTDIVATEQAHTDATQSLQAPLSDIGVPTLLDGPR